MEIAVVAEAEAEAAETVAMIVAVAWPLHSRDLGSIFVTVAGAGSGRRISWCNLRT